ncbi:MAG: ABC transporter permease [Candidatus Micrarchaeia archaeon]
MNQELTAVYFLWKREIIRFLRSKSRIIGSIGMPFFFLVMLGFGIGGIVSLEGGESYLDFVAPGILGMVLLFGSVFSGAIVIMDKQFGFLKETLVAPVRRESIVLGKALGGASTAVIQGILMIVVMALMGVSIPLHALPLLFAVMFLVSMAFVSVGISLASIMEDMHGFQLTVNFLIFPMFLFSGAIFPLDSVPEILQYLSYVDPLTYGVDAMRIVLLGTARFSLVLDLGILLVFLAVTTSLAAYLFRRIES